VPFSAVSTVRQQKIFLVVMALYYLVQTMFEIFVGVILAVTRSVFNIQKLSVFICVNLWVNFFLLPLCLMPVFMPLFHNS